METGRPGVSRVAIAVDGEVTLRAAQSLSVHPGVDEVVVLSPSENTHFATVENARGFDVLVGTDRAAPLGVRDQVPVAVTGDLPDQPGVSLGSPIGLALALAVGLEAVEIVGVATPGDAEGAETVVFPSPIDARFADKRKIDGHLVHVAGGDGPLAAAMVLGAGRHRVIVDDHRFMAGVALAAAAAVSLATGLDGPVWTRAAEYLRTAVEMGLVIGERPG